MKITEFDDRSGSPEPGEHSFGYVYFDDGTRVGCTPSAAEAPVWEPSANGNGRFAPVTQEHLTLAMLYLREKGILPDA